MDKNKPLDWDYFLICWKDKNGVTFKQEEIELLIKILADYCNTEREFKSLAVHNMNVTEPLLKKLWGLKECLKKA